jgi:hypothetical protein
MVPPPLPGNTKHRDAPGRRAPLGQWVRGSLVGIALGLVAVFAIAWRLDPYYPDGRPRRSETHRQLNLPPCAFRAATGMPCPSCGMTTSFALLVRGDLVNSLQANAVGTLLALFCLVLVPWSLGSAWRRQPLYIRSVERAMTTLVLVFLGLMMFRWVVVLALGWWTGTPLDS